MEIYHTRKLIYRRVVREESLYKRIIKEKRTEKTYQKNHVNLVELIAFFQRSNSERVYIPTFKISEKCKLYLENGTNLNYSL